MPSTRTKRLAVALEVGADERARCALQHADDLAGRVLDVGRLARDADHHLVAGRGVERLVFADEHFRLEHAVHGVRPDEPVPGLRTAVDAGEGAVRVRGAECVVAAHREPPGADQFAHRLAELGVLLFREVESLEQRLRLDGDVALRGDGVEDFRE